MQIGQALRPTGTVARVDTAALDRLVADLDPAQRHAVTTESTRVAVIAGAGSGKTRVLTRRVAWRVRLGTAEAAHTLVLTFTREATGELRRRLPQLGLPGRVTAGTFHSVALQMLRQRWADLDRRAPELVPDRTRLLADVAGGRRELDEGLLADVDWATTRGLDSTAFARAVTRGEYRPIVDVTRVASTLDAYAAAKHGRRQIDLDDVLVLTVGEIASDAAYRAAVHWRFRHVLVDEAQDLNPLQHRLVAALAEPGDLYLVGDPAQAIYGFNGADPALLVDVETRFPGIEVIRLPANHRSTPQVVAAGVHALARGDGDAPAEQLAATRPDGVAVRVVSHVDEAAEAASVAAAIGAADPALVRTGHVAVLARTHATLEPVRAALGAAGIAIRHAPDGPGSELAPLLRQAYRLGSGRDLREWGHAQLEEAAERGDDDDAALPRVGRAVLDFVLEQPGGDGAALRAWVDSTDPFGASTAGVELATFHAAKGREWHTVLLVGCETSLVPHRSARTAPARTEEARLFYVAITRATDDLTISWAARRNGYQRRPTPFLDGFVSEVPPAVAPPQELLRPRAAADVLADHLHAWRAGLARAADILPEAVCSDRVLTTIASARPGSAAELDEVTGLGAITSARLWPTLAEVLAAS